MTPLIADVFKQIGADPFLVAFLVLLVTVASVAVAVCWTIVGDRIERMRVRNWPKVSAIVDVVSVAYCEPGGGPILHFKASSYNPYYRATLTYIYRNPEEQMGDYSRDFGNEDDAKDWANSYKGESVKVHVDPRDPTRSVLREEDL